MRRHNGGQQTSSNSTAGLCAALIASLAWAGLTSEAITSRSLTRAAGLSAGQSALFFFRYFTNQAITILACVMTITAARLARSQGMLDARIYAAAVVYVVVTAVVYEAFLRRLWSPKGFWFARDALMHDVLPLSALLFWIFLAPKDHLAWIDAMVWLVYPALYWLVTLAVGRCSKSYPYSFLDPEFEADGRHAYRICGLACAFYACGLALITVSHVAR